VGCLSPLNHERNVSKWVGRTKPGAVSQPSISGPARVPFRESFARSGFEGPCSRRGYATPARIDLGCGFLDGLRTSQGVRRARLPHR